MSRPQAWIVAISFAVIALCQLVQLGITLEVRAEQRKLMKLQSEI